VDSWHVFPVEPLGRGTEIEPALLDAAEYARLVEFYERVRDAPGPTVRFGELSSFHRRYRADLAERLSRCQAGISSLCVLANGDVVACMQERGPVQGSVREESLLSIWTRGFGVNRSPDWRRCARHRFG